MPTASVRGARRRGAASALLAAASLVVSLALPAPATATPPPDLTWLARYTGTIGNNEVASMAVDAAGNSFVTGSSEGIGWDIATIKYDAQGHQVWAVRYDGGHGGDDIPVQIALDPDGNVIVAGYTQVRQGNNDYLTLKYSNDTHRFGNLDDLFFFVLVDDSDGLQVFD